MLYNKSMLKNRRAYTLVELIVTMAVLGIATTLIVAFSISTAKSVKSEKQKNDVVYQVKDAHDYVLGWFSTFDTTDYSLESVTDSVITFEKTSDHSLYTLEYSDGLIKAMYAEKEVTFQMDLIDNITFSSKDNALKMTVVFPDGQTDFIIYKKTQ